MNIKEKNKKRGISLIVLTIIIIVIIILAAAIILSINTNNPIGSANEAVFKSDMKTIQNEVSLYISSQYANTNGSSVKKDYTAEEMNSIFKSVNKYNGEISVKDSKVVYSGSDTNKKKWAKEVGINVITLDASKVKIIQTGGYIESFENVPENATLYYHASEKQISDINNITNWTLVENPGSFNMPLSGVTGLYVYVKLVDNNLNEYDISYSDYVPSINSGSAN